uniref:Uncharacterized protein n=1 Tax=Rhizophora mucronata TaxID=61149 RepID=A0A2P2KJC4_RHIMU
MRQMKEKILSEMKLMIFQYHQIGDLPDFILLSLFVQWHHVQILSLQVIPMERASRWSLPCVLSHAYCLGVIRRIEWVESLKKHHPSSGEEGLLEWKKAIVECSNMTFAIATSEVLSRLLFFIVIFVSLNIHAEHIMCLYIHYLQLANKHCASYFLIFPS